MIDSSVRQAPCSHLHKTNWRMGKMTLRINLPGGTLKVKTYRELRDRERDRRVPVVKVGSIYFIWWSNRKPIKKSPPI